LLFTRISVSYGELLVFVGEPDMNMLERFHEYQEKAEIYYLYHSIHRYTVSIQVHPLKNKVGTIVFSEKRPEGTKCTLELMV